MFSDPTIFGAALATGFTLGLRHALDPDHISAVSTLSVGNRKYASILRLAVWWGAGHTLTIALSGLILVLMKSVVPPTLELLLEAAVGIMLVFLGVRLVVSGNPKNGNTHRLRTQGQSFIVGAVHGLAGSAAVLLVAAAAIDTAVGVLLFVLVFGAGSIMGMLLFTGLLGIPMHVYGESVAFNRIFGRVAAAVSIVVGVLVVLKSLIELVSR